MANERPSARPGGYWLASADPSMPDHAWLQYLLSMIDGSDGSSSDIPQPPSAFPSGNPASPPSNNFWDEQFVDRRQPANAFAPMRRASRLGGMEFNNAFKGGL